MKLSIAMIVGLILGVEREVKHKPLGIKTCIVISVASCLLTIVSIHAAFDMYNGVSFIRSDPMRLAAQIISGVGFLGAGVILRRNNDVISGLTTAAIVWAASGFGIAVGAGYYYEVAIGLLIMITSIKLFPYIIHKYGPESIREQEIRVNILIASEISVRDFIEKVGGLVSEVRETHILSNKNGNKIMLRCMINNSPQDLFEQYCQIEGLDGVKQVEIKSI